MVASGQPDNERFCFTSFLSVFFNLLAISTYSLRRKKKKEKESYLAVILVSINSFLNEWGIFLFVCVCFWFCLLFTVAPAAYGSSQARGRIGAAAAGLGHSHSTGSELHL